MPSLYDNGLLSLRYIAIQEKSGPKWNKATMYHPDKRYRVRMRLYNRSKAGVVFPNLLADYAATDVYIAAISIDLDLNGAKFWDPNFQEWKLNSARIALTKKKDFNDNIAPEKSRYFHVEFTWAPVVAAPVRMFPIQIDTLHREIMVRKRGAGTTLNINQ